MPRVAIASLCLLLASHASAAGSAFVSRTEANPEPVAKTVRTNPDRSYPPSCLSLPLPQTVSGPFQQVVKSLADIDGNEAGLNGQTGYFENVQVTVWRVACSSNKSAVVVALDRPGNRENTLPAPDVPAPYGTQPNRNLVPLRIIREPNTIQAYEGGDTIFGSDVYILEKVSGSAFDFDAAFTLSLDTIALNGDTLRTNISIPAYNPAQNPGAALALEITGYVAGAWYDPAKGGEGLLFDVGERANGTRFAFFAWFTYDKQGFPYWIVGNADIPAGARTITIPALVFDQGGFAGAFTPPLPSQAWGSVTFTFPSCNALTLQFASTLTSTTIPTGSGTRNWIRLTGVNGFSCE
jgi:hypothetical protein